MKIKTFLVASVLSLAPIYAAAACSGYGHTTASISCAEGMVFDAETGACVVIGA